MWLRLAGLLYGGGLAVVCTVLAVVDWRRTDGLLRAVYRCGEDPGASH